MISIHLSPVSESRHAALMARRMISSELHAPRTLRPSGASVVDHNKATAPWSALGRHAGAGACDAPNRVSTPSAGEV